MHSKEYFLLESSLEGFGVAQSSLLLTYAHTVSCTEMYWTITLPLLPRMLTNILIQLCMLHIFSYCRSFASSSIVHFWRRLVEKPYNRNSSFKHLPLASSSSLITTCNPPCRHLYPTHVFLCTRRSHMVKNSNVLVCKQIISDCRSSPHSNF
jgi:hypothetical protein